MGTQTIFDPLGQFDDNSPIKEKTRAQYLQELIEARNFLTGSVARVIEDNRKHIMLAITLIGNEIKDYERLY